jgi:D-alanine-D-alanine ligase
LRLQRSAPEKVLVLAYLEPGEMQPDAAVAQVARALELGGCKTRVVAIQHDIEPLRAAVSEFEPDLIFNLLESFGGDMPGGQIGVAGLLDLLRVPYTGGGPGELYLQEDKALTKRLLAYDDIRYPDFALFAPGADFEIGGRLHMPLFVKPARMDASLGIDERSLVHDFQGLIERVQAIHQSFGAALAEEYIEGREFYVGVLGNHAPAVLPPIEMDFSELPESSLPIMDNEAKFDPASPRYRGTRPVVAQLDEALRATLQKTASAAYRALRVRDYGRIDMRLTPTGEVYVIEVNASCYLEQQGEFAMAAAAAGIEYAELIGRIAKLALERRLQS